MSRLRPKKQASACLPEPWPRRAYFILNLTSNYLAETRESAEKRKRRSAQALSCLNFSVEVRPSERLSGSATTADKEFAVLSRMLSGWLRSLPVVHNSQRHCATAVLPHPFPFPIATARQGRELFKLLINIFQNYIPTCWSLIIKKSLPVSFFCEMGRDLGWGQVPLINRRRCRLLVTCYSE